jgi:plastocyanin
MTRHFSIRAALLVMAAIGALALVPRLAGDVLNKADAAGVVLGADNVSSVREIQLVARDMTFYVDGQDAPNPTLHARPGERIRIILRNTDVGMSHDFVIRSWSVNTRLLKGKGQDSIEFTVPETRGSHAYSCTPHAEMMGGTIAVN